MNDNDWASTKQSTLDWTRTTSYYFKQLPASAAEAVRIQAWFGGGKVAPPVLGL